MSSLLSIFYGCRWLVLVLLAFSFLYAFKLPVVGNSAYIAFVLLAIFVFLSSQSFSNALYLFKEPIVIFILFSFIMIAALAVAVTSFHNVYDYSIVTSLINNLLSVIGVIFLVSILHGRHEKSVIDLFVTLLLIQSVIIIAMLVLPSLRELIQGMIRSESEMARLSGYAGVRGLGLSGSIAFGLAVTMGTLVFFLHYWLAYYQRNKSSIMTFCILSLALLASLSAGRTAVLGFLVGLIFYPMVYSIPRYFLQSFKQVLTIAIGVALLLIYIFNNEALYQVAYRYSLYVFQFMWNYLDSGSFSVSSLETLEQMYFIPDDDVWLFGTGHYTSADGSYYMNTDAGYMRFLLFFGAIGSAFIYILFVTLTFLLYLKTRHHIKGAFILSVLLIVMAFIFHYKGEVVMYNVPFMKLYFALFFYYMLYDKPSIHTTTSKVLVSEDKHA